MNINMIFKNYIKMNSLKSIKKSISNDLKEINKIISTLIQ